MGGDHDSNNDGNGNAGQRAKILQLIPHSMRFFTLVALILEAGFLGIAVTQDDPVVKRQLIDHAFTLFIVLIGVAGALELLRLVFGRPTKTGEAATAPAPRYEVFLSAPMADITDEATYKLQRDEILRVKDALRKFCRFETTFYAGTDIEAPDGFNTEHIALRGNFRRIQESRRLMLIYPKRSGSSILFEAGLAIAFGKPSVWFIKAGEKLPYLMRGAAGASESEGLPRMRVYTYDSVADIVKRMENDGAGIFT